jgi:hypothetical protein
MIFHPTRLFLAAGSTSSSHIVRGLVARVRARGPARKPHAERGGSHDGSTHNDNHKRPRASARTGTPPPANPPRVCERPSASASAESCVFQAVRIGPAHVTGHGTCVHPQQHGTRTSHLHARGLRSQFNHKCVKHAETCPPPVPSTAIAGKGAPVYHPLLYHHGHACRDGATAPPAWRLQCACAAGGTL